MTTTALPNRAILSLTGPDTLALLERTVTHSVTDWEADALRYGALLTPQGKVIADYLATRTADGVLLDVHEDAVDDLAKRLKMFRLRSDVQIERLEDHIVTFDWEGAHDARGLSSHDHRLIVQGATETFAEDYNAVRIAAGIPEWGADYRAAEVFPTDVNMDVMGGIDYKKGCFVGQEVASRMKRRGKIKKRTVVLTGADMTTGDQVMAGDVPAGDVTSAAGGKALARIRLDRAAGKTLTVRGAAAVMDMPDWLADEMKALVAND